mmetsp:Transcript_23483/g.33740  ORF Transcript_23483/g.33740 Transcript_23483/m.33740 type:complete len:113 (-) Transcript_23483:270-608(-)
MWTAKPYTLHHTYREIRTPRAGAPPVHALPRVKTELRAPIDALECLLRTTGAICAYFFDIYERQLHDIIQARFLVYSFFALACMISSGILLVPDTYADLRASIICSMNMTKR